MHLCSFESWAGWRNWECCSSNERPPPLLRMQLDWNFKAFWYSTKSRWVKCCWIVEISSILSLEHNSRIKKFLITELCSIPKKSGIVLNSRPLSSRDFGFHWEQSTIPGGIVDGNWAQGTELWLGIELKGWNSRNLRHLSANVSMAITTVYCEKRGNHVITRDGNWAQFPSGNQALCIIHSKTEHIAN